MQLELFDISEYLDCCLKVIDRVKRYLNTASLSMVDSFHFLERFTIVEMIWRGYRYRKLFMDCLRPYYFKAALYV